MMETYQVLITLSVKKRWCSNDAFAKTIRYVHILVSCLTTQGKMTHSWEWNLNLYASFVPISWANCSSPCPHNTLAIPTPYPVNQMTPPYLSTVSILNIDKAIPVNQEIWKHLRVRFLPLPAGYFTFCYSLSRSSITVQKVKGNQISSDS